MGRWIGGWVCVFACICECAGHFSQCVRARAWVCPCVPFWVTDPPPKLGLTSRSGWKWLSKGEGRVKWSLPVLGMVCCLSLLFWAFLSVCICILDTRYWNSLFLFHVQSVNDRRFCCCCFKKDAFWRLWWEVQISSVLHNGVANSFGTGFACASKRCNYDFVPTFLLWSFVALSKGNGKWCSKEEQPAVPENLAPRSCGIKPHLLWKGHAGMEFSIFILHFITFSSFLSTRSVLLSCFLHLFCISGKYSDSKGETFCFCTYLLLFDIYVGSVVAYFWNFL